jgi:hypothetical protein
MSILLSSDFYVDLDHLVLDECHCTFDWGESFRKAWNNISKIRALVKHGIPILAVSATMTPAILAHVWNVLAIDPNTSAHLNLGNDRPNIVQIVHRMPKAKDFAALAFVFRSVSHTGRLPRSIIYFETRDLAQKAMAWLRAHLPAGCDHLKTKIDYLHAASWDAGRAEKMRRFRAQVIDMLCSTECAGMGNDEPHVDLVVLFQLPSDLPKALQLGGRAGRAKQNAQMILLVEPSAFQMVSERKKRAPKQPKARAIKGESDSEADDNKEDSDDDDVVLEDVVLEDVVLENGGADAKDITDVDADKPPPRKTVHRKKVDSDLRRYIETLDCRRMIANDVFANPPIAPDARRDRACCDNCIKPTLPVDARNLNGLLAYLDRVAPLPSAMPDPMALIDGAPAQAPAAKAKRKRRSRVGLRQGEHRIQCEELLETWRSRTYRKTYSDRPYGPTGVLSDALLSELAKNMRFLAISDLESNATLKHWRFIKEHGEEVLGILRVVDQQRNADKQRAAQAIVEKRKAEQLAQAEEAAEAKRRKHEADVALRQQKAIEYIAASRRPRPRPVPVTRPPQPIAGSSRQHAAGHPLPTPIAAPSAYPYMHPAAPAHPYTHPAAPAYHYTHPAAPAHQHTHPGAPAYQHHHPAAPAFEPDSLPHSQPWHASHFYPAPQTPSQVSFPSQPYAHSQPHPAHHYPMHPQQHQVWPGHSVSSSMQRLQPPHHGTAPNPSMHHNPYNNFDPFTHPPH